MAVAGPAAPFPGGAPSWRDEHRKREPVRGGLAGPRSSCQQPLPLPDDFGPDDVLMEGNGKPDRVLRGGSWNNNANNMRAANRNNNTPGFASPVCDERHEI